MNRTAPRTTGEDASIGSAALAVSFVARPQSAFGLEWADSSRRAVDALVFTDMGEGGGVRCGGDHHQHHFHHYIDHSPGRAGGREASTGSDFDELAARVRSLRRRQGNEMTNQLSLGPLLFDRTALICGDSIALSRRELSLLELLPVHRGRILSKGQILDSLFDSRSEPTENAVEVLVGPRSHNQTRPRRGILSEYQLPRRRPRPTISSFISDIRSRSRMIATDSLHPLQR